jgi:hypothetical protein
VRNRSRSLSVVRRWFRNGDSLCWRDEHSQVHSLMLWIEGRTVGIYCTKADHADAL